MAEENTFTTIFRADISQFSSSAQQLNNYVKTINSEFNLATASMDKWSDNTDGLTAKLKQLNGVLEAQKARLNSLEAEYAQLQKEGKENTSQGQRLYKQIVDQQTAVKKTEKDINRYSASLSDLQKAGVKTTAELNDLTKAQEKQGETAKAVGASIAKGITASIATLGATAVATGVAIAKMTSNVAKNGDEIDKESQKLSISAESYQELSYAMERSGADIADLTKGIRTITSELAKIEDGADGAGESFAKLGIDVKNADGSMKTNEQVLFDTIDALSKMANETQRDALAQEIFGRSSAELKPLLNAGAEGIQALMQEAKDYGMVMSDEAVKASASFSDSLLRLKGSATGLSASLLSDLIPSFSGVMDGFSDMLAGIDGGQEKMADGIKNLIKQINSLIPSAVDIIKTIADAVLQEAPSILDSLIDGLIDALPNVIDTITENLLPQALDALIGAFPKILEALSTIVGKVIASLGKLFPRVVKALVAMTPQLLEGAIRLFMAIVEAIPEMMKELIPQIPEIITAIVQALIEGAPRLFDVGKELIKGLWEGIKSAGAWLWEKITDFFGGIVDGIKDFFGIHSPSRLFKDEIGKNLALGIGEGFEDEMSSVSRDMRKSLDGLTPTLNVGGLASSDDSTLARLAEMIGSKMGNVTNNYSVTNQFKGMESTRYALHKSNLELKKIIGG